MEIRERTVPGNLKCGRWRRINAPRSVQRLNVPMLFPDDVFHFYKCPEPQYAHLLAFVSRIIASRDPKLRLEEPLVFAGLLEYERGAEALKSWQWWYAHAHCLSPNRMDDGTVVVNREKHLLVRWNSKFEAVRTLAVPLVQITSADELRTHVIDVLDEEFRNVSI